MKEAKLIVMLTHHDYTVENALSIFDTSRRKNIIDQRTDAR